MPRPYQLDLPGRRSRYATSLDRAGAALAAGGGMAGVIACILVAANSASTPFGLLMALPVGTVLGACGIVALGGLPWLVCHATGRRGPRAAVLLGAALGFLLFLGSQTGGFGATLAPSDAQTALYRWLSAGLTSAVMALFGAAIAFVMWRVGYRRVA